MCKDFKCQRCVQHCWGFNKSMQYFCTSLAREKLAMWLLGIRLCGHYRCAQHCGVHTTIFGHHGTIMMHFGQALQHFSNHTVLGLNICLIWRTFCLFLYSKEFWNRVSTRSSHSPCQHNLHWKCDFVCSKCLLLHLGLFVLCMTILLCFYYCMLFCNKELGEKQKHKKRVFQKGHDIFVGNQVQGRHEEI